MSGSVICIIRDEDNEQMLVNPNSSLKEAYQALENGDNHIPFVHKYYKDFFREGIPLINLQPKTLSNGKRVFNLMAFLPKNVSFGVKEHFKNTIERISENYSIARKDLIAVYDKNSFGYNYEVYPPLVEEVDTSFGDVIDMYYRDMKDISSVDEKNMFDTFRNFDLEKMFFDESYYDWPINHNGCGVYLFTREGEVLSSTVTKRLHIEDLSYLLSSYYDENLTYRYSFPEIVTKFGMGVGFIRSQKAQIFIPTSITEEQKKKIGDTYLELVDTAGEDFVSLGVVSSDALGITDAGKGIYSVNQILETAAVKNESEKGSSTNKKRSI